MLCRGGQVRSSDEASVMEVEQRDLTILAAFAASTNCVINLGGTCEYSKTI